MCSLSLFQGNNALWSNIKHEKKVKVENSASDKAENKGQCSAFIIHFHKVDISVNYSVNRSSWNNHGLQAFFIKNIL